MLLPLIWVPFIQGQPPPSVSLPNGTRVTFKRFTQGSKFKPNPKARGERYEHPIIETDGSSVSATSTWPSKYLMVFDLAGGDELDDWRVMAFDDDGYSCEVQPFIIPEKAAFYLQDPLPIGSKRITLRFEPKSLDQITPSKSKHPLEMVIENPFFVIPESIKPQPLPQTRPCFGAQVTLTSAVRRKLPAQGQYPLELKYKTTKDGVPWHGLEWSKIVIEDGYGIKHEFRGGGGTGFMDNYSIGIRQEVPWRSSIEWKVNLHLKRTAESNAFSEAEQYKVPRLDLSSTEALTVGTDLSSNGPVQIRVVDGNSVRVDWQGEPNTEKRLILLGVRDDQGRPVNTNGSESGSEAAPWLAAGVLGLAQYHVTHALETKPDAKWLNVIFAFHEPEVVEFTVRPTFLEQ
jgi:hypothetical protein